VDAVPDRLAFSWLDEDGVVADWSYARLDAEARRIAGFLQYAGRGRDGDGSPRRALLMYPPSLGYVAAFFGCLYAGVIPVPAYPPYNEHVLARLRAIARDADVTYALTPEASEAITETIALDTPAFERWVATDHLPPSAAEDWRDDGAAAEDVAFLQYTSGSTGRPRGVVISYRNLAAQLSAIATRFEMDSEASVVSWLPPYHDMGLIGCILGAVAWRSPCRLMSPETFLRRPVTWLRAFEDWPRAASPAPNFAYDLCVRRVSDDDLPALDLSTWEVAINGAEPVRAETLERFAERFAPCGFRRRSLQPSYGLAEATLLISGGRFEREPLEADADLLAEGRVVPAEPGDTVRRLVSCGPLIEGNEAVVVDTDSRPLPDDTVGEIMLSGPTIAAGYWDAAAATARPFADRVQGSDRDWLRTGDIGFLHEGELYVTGRVKDVIIVNGRNHYPDDVERSVERLDARLRPGCGAAVQVVDPTGRQLLALVQETTAADDDEDLEELLAAIREVVRREHQLTLDAVALVPPRSIPKTSSGKVRRLAAGSALIEERIEVLASWSARKTAPA
jgi:acyl-CoA synthetase (AMP-forming)/AMP-acid ligase II